MTRLRLNLRTMSVNRALVYISPHLTSASALPGKPQRHRNRFPELERCISGVSFQVSNLHLFNVVNLRLILMPMNASLHLVINEVQVWWWATSQETYSWECHTAATERFVPPNYSINQNQTATSRTYWSNTTSFAPANYSINHIQVTVHQSDTSDNEIRQK